MLNVFRQIVEELKAGTHPAYIESLDKAIEHFEKQIHGYPWQTSHERSESQRLLDELRHLKSQRMNPASGPDDATASGS